MKIESLNIDTINSLLKNLEDHQDFLMYKIKEQLKEYNTLVYRIKKDHQEILQMHEAITNRLDTQKEEIVDELENLLIVTEEAHIQALVTIRSIAEKVENLTLTYMSASIS